VRRVTPPWGGEHPVLTPHLSVLRPPNCELALKPLGCSDNRHWFKISSHSQAISREFRTSYLKVGVIEVIGDVPAQHEELASFNEHRVEIAETEEQLLVFIRLVTTIELLITNTLIHSLHVCLQTLHSHTWLTCYILRSTTHVLETSIINQLQKSGANFWHRFFVPRCIWKKYSGKYVRKIIWRGSI